MSPFGGYDPGGPMELTAGPGMWGSVEWTLSFKPFHAGSCDLTQPSSTHKSKGYLT